MSEAPVTLDELLPRLRCPHSHLELRREADALVSSDGAHRYPIEAGSVDLRAAPPRLQIDLPWYEPWDDLDALAFQFPEPLEAPDLPYHLDAHLARIPGEQGNSRWIVEIGCGERQCEPYFLKRDFRYVGTDVDHRGVGPHVKADAHNLPFQAETIDFYCSFAVYEHLVSPLTAALEAARVLRPGGVFFGSAAFAYGFHDRASFHHMTHAGLLWTLRSAGFERIQMWPDWYRWQSMGEMGFPGPGGAPFRGIAKATLRALDWGFPKVSNAARKLAGKQALDPLYREVTMAGSLSFAAYKAPF